MESLNDCQEGERRKGAYKHYRTMVWTEQNETDDAIAVSTEIPTQKLFGRSMDKKLLLLAVLLKNLCPW